MIGAIISTLAGSFQRAPWGWGILAFMVAVFAYLWPVINKQVMEAKQQLRSYKREVQKEEKDDLRDLVTALRAQVDEQGQHIEKLRNDAQSYQLKLVSALAGFRLLAGELEKLDPSNPVLKQANDLIAMAATGDMGMGKVIDELSRLPAVKREKAA